MKGFLAILGMDLRNLFKNPVLLGYNTVFAGALILILGWLMGDAYARLSDAYQYYTITLLVYGMFSGAMTATNCFMERDIKKPNLRIIYSPAGASAIWLSKMLASFIFDYVLHALLVIPCVFLLGVTIGTQPLVFILLMIPVELLGTALGTFGCCVLHSEEFASTVLSLVVSLLCVLGGSFFAPDALGGPIAALSHLSPVRWVNDAFFAVACDNDFSLFWPVFAGSLVVVVILTIGCKHFFRTEDYL